MSVKTLENEFDKVFQQYHEMLTDLHDMEAEASQEMVPPEFIDRLKAQIEPIKQNFEWWSYVMYLLHEPQRGRKKAKYAKQSKNRLSTLDPQNSPQARRDANQKILSELKERN